MMLAASPPPPPLRHSLELYAAVVLGSVIGSVLRALMSLALVAGFGSGFVWPTLFVNVTGSFIVALNHSSVANVLFFQAGFVPHGQPVEVAQWQV